MKKTFTLLFILFFILLIEAAQAQHVITRDNFPQPGDVVERVDVIGIASGGDNGENVIWDFSESLTTLGSLVYSFDEPANLEGGENFPASNLGRIDGDARIYYTVDEASLEQIGLVGVSNNLLINYSNPIKEMCFPFTFGDSYSDTGIGFYTTGGFDVDVTTTVDVTSAAYGTLILPNGVFENVTRVTKTVVREDRVQDNPTYLDITNQFIQWFADGHNYPILEIQNQTVDNNGNESQGTFVSHVFIKKTDDEYGYSYETNNEGVECGWVDITESGTEVTGLADDNFVGPFDLGFDFDYYWTTETQFYVGSNGFISFGTEGFNIASTGIGFPSLPTADNLDNIIAPLLSDLNLDGGNNPGKVYYGKDGDERLVISYINVPFWTNNANGFTEESNSFQIILDANDSSVRFNYGTMATAVADEYAASTNPVVVGIENSTGSIGLEFTSNFIPESNSCIHFTAPETALIDVVDVSPISIQNPQNRGFFVVRGEPNVYTATFANTGNVAIEETIIANISIYSAEAAQAPLVSRDFEISGLATGATAELSIDDFSPLADGEYFVLATSALGSDINANNDVRGVEFVVISEDVLGYALDNVVAETFANSNGGFTGFGYESGLGVYFQPPFQDYEILSLEYYMMAGNGQTNITTGFEAQILDGTSGPSAPGAQLFSEIVFAGDIVQDSWHQIFLTTPVNITSGQGFFVGWLAEEQGASVGVETTAPFSRNTYEIISHTWSSYRSKETTDFAIRARVRSLTNNIDVVISPSEMITYAYPNPASEALNIGVNGKMEGKTLQLFNAKGQLLIEQTASTKTVMDISQLAAGLYLLKDSEGLSPSKTIVIE